MEEHIKKQPQSQPPGPSSPDMRQDGLTLLGSPPGWFSERFLPQTWTRQREEVFLAFGISTEDFFDTGASPTGPSLEHSRALFIWGQSWCRSTSSFERKSDPSPSEKE